MKLILDTCCVIWAVSESSSLSDKAKSLLTADDSEIYVSVITVAELACAVDRQCIALDRHWKKWFRHYVDINGWEAKDINIDIMEEAYSLPGEFHSDPSDRIITATARLNRYTILTADRKILKYPHVNSIW